MKKLIALAATALMSMHASAGYVQYDLTGPISGFVVQHDDDGSIAFYGMQMVVDMPSLGRSASFQITPMYEQGISVTTTHFPNGNGPTNFTNYDRNDGTIDTLVNVTFSRSNEGNFKYTANYNAGLWMWDGWHYSKGVMDGLATKGVVHESLARSLDYYGGYDPQVIPMIPTYIGPARVPEPSTFALLAIGALGVAGLRRCKPQ
jgi:hypothetical protein